MSEKYHGSMSLSDGSRVQLTEDQVKAIFSEVEKKQAERVQQMPTTQAALSAMCSARERLRELGWKETLYCPRDDREFAVCEIGSTGMWSAFFSGEFVHYADCVATPGRSMFFKSLDKLSEDEKQQIERCDEQVRNDIARIGEVFG